jgi:hypothetical protein
MRKRLRAAKAALRRDLALGILFTGSSLSPVFFPSSRFRPVSSRQLAGW